MDNQILKHKQKMVMLTLFERYRTLVEKAESINDLCPPYCTKTSILRLIDEATINIDIYPFDKLNRWLGFIQGVMAVKAVIDVEAERDFSRPLFHLLYEQAPDPFPPKET